VPLHGAEPNTADVNKPCLVFGGTQSPDGRFAVAWDLANSAATFTYPETEQESRVTTTGVVRDTGFEPVTPTVSR
jgi:hypothetical protein